MKPLSLAFFTAAAFAPHVVFSASFITPRNPSLFGSSNASFSAVDERRLDVLTVDTICKNEDNTPLVGRRQLYGAPFQLGAVYARCDEDHKPTCYMDDGTIDRMSTDEEIDCSDAVKALPKPGSTSRGGDRQLATAWKNVPLWPNGVVCYNLMDADDPVVQAELNEAKKAEVSKMIKDAMERYENGGPLGDSTAKKTNIKFVHIDDCKGLDCNRCRHFVNFEFEVRKFDRDHFNPDKPDKHSCWSYVGYWPGLSTQLENGDQFMRKLLDPLGDKSRIKKLSKRMNDVLLRVKRQHMTYQPLNLSPSCWNENTIAHEIGHTLGLLHDHQRSDRKVMLKTDVIYSDKIEEIDEDEELTAEEKTKAKANVYKDFEIVNKGEYADGLCGQYDMESIMHYDSYYMCVPANGKPESFCDVGEAISTVRVGARDGCTLGRAAQCAPDEKQKTLERPLTYQPTEKDYQILKNMYARSHSCTIQ